MAMSDISPTTKSNLRTDVQQLSQQQRRAAATATKSSSHANNNSSTATNPTGPRSGGKPGQHLNIVV